MLVIGPPPLAETFAERLDPYYRMTWGDPALGNLINFLRVEGNRYDAVIFLDHSYPPTRNGLGFVADRAILIPLIDSPEALAGDQARDLFSLPRAFGFRSAQEGAMVQRALGGEGIPHEIVNPGLDELTALERLIALVAPQD